jgi:hypothetical protein
MSEPAIEHPARGHRATTTQLDSPLDPYLEPLLRWIAKHDSGFNPSRSVKDAATRFDWPAPFVEVLFTAARVRGLLEPFYLAGNRGKISWRISNRGASWAASRTAAGDS